MDYRLLSVFPLFLWGIWGFITKILTRNTAAATIALWSTIASIIPILIYTLLTGTMRWVKTAPIALLSGLAAGLATIFFYIAIKKGPASVVIPLTGMYIILPSFLSYVILKEPLNLKHLIGLGFAILAILFLT